MSYDCFDERKEFRKTLSKPPTPGPRRPLSRMVIDKSPKGMTAEYPPSVGSPLTGACESNYEEPELSQDEEPELYLSGNNSTSSSDPSSPDSDANRGPHKRSHSLSPGINETYIKARASPHISTSPASIKARSKSGRPSNSDTYKTAEEKIKTQHTSQANRTKSRTLSVVFFLVAVLVPVGCYLCGRNSSANDSSMLDNAIIEEDRQRSIETLRSRIEEMKRSFPGLQPKNWRDIEVGIREVIRGSQKPWTFILFSNETKGISCLARLLGKASSQALRSQGSLELHPSDMGDDYGRAIDRLEKQIFTKKSVVVHDLLNISPRAIQAFHTMCDRENPLVKEAVYILTLITPRSIPQSIDPVKFVEDELTNRFVDKVAEEKLQPLITRLTDGSIIPVKPENTLNECPL